jgi:hypothetical protein
MNLYFIILFCLLFSIGILAVKIHLFIDSNTFCSIILLFYGIALYAIFFVGFEILIKLIIFELI